MTRAATLAALAALCVVSASAGCAGMRPRRGTAALPPPGASAAGYRALFRGAAEGPAGRDHFRMAVAILPPDRVRLEFFGPVGGTRALLAIDGEAVRLLMPAERAYDTAPATAPGVQRILGLPLDPPRLIALLTGRPMCAAETVEQRVMTRAAAAFGRTVAWYDVLCPPGDFRYHAKADDRGGALREATLREGISGAIILRVEYDDYGDGPGSRFPGRMRLRLDRHDATITLAAVDGPGTGEIPEGIFTPPIPEDFERRPLAFSLSAPGRVGSPADRER